MKAISNIRAVMAILIFFFSLSFVSCTEETLDYNNPDVDLFVKQLKAGKYSVESPEGLNTIPRFTVDDIGDLLKYAEDLTVIPSFPLAPVSYSAGGKLRLGECILWTVETIRLGQNASMAVSYTHLRAHETGRNLVCRLLLEKKNLNRLIREKNGENSRI